VKVIPILLSGGNKKGIASRDLHQSGWRVLETTWPDGTCSKSFDVEECWQCSTSKFFPRLCIPGRQEWKEGAEDEGRVHSLKERSSRWSSEKLSSKARDSVETLGWQSLMGALEKIIHIKSVISKQYSCNWLLHMHIVRGHIKDRVKFRLTSTNKSSGTQGLHQSRHKCSAASLARHVQLVVPQQHVRVSAALCS